MGGRNLVTMHSSGLRGRRLFVRLDANSGRCRRMKAIHGPAAEVPWVAGVKVRAAVRRVKTSGKICTRADRAPFVVPRFVPICIQVHISMETLSIRIDSETRKRLDALAVRTKRSKSFLVAEAINAYMDAEKWRIGEMEAGVEDLENGREVSHARVAAWVESWGTPGETTTPR